MAHHVERRIVDGEMQPGERLGTKSELREQYGVAVATVNEALRLLETRGLVEARPGPGGGVFVAAVSSQVRLTDLVRGFDLSDTPFYDCIAIRNTLEPLVCHEAARYCQPRDAKALRRIADRMSAAVDDPAEFLACTIELHRRLANVCANVLLKALYLTLLGYVQEGLEQLDADAAFDAQDLDVHRELVEAIIGGDDDRIEQALEAHRPIAQRWAEAEIG